MPPFLSRDDDDDDDDGYGYGAMNALQRSETINAAMESFEQRRAAALLAETRARYSIEMGHVSVDPTPNDNDPDNTRNQSLAQRLARREQEGFVTTAFDEIEENEETDLANSLRRKVRLNDNPPKRPGQGQARVVARATKQSRIVKDGTSARLQLDPLAIAASASSSSNTQDVQDELEDINMGAFVPAPCPSFCRYSGNDPVRPPKRRKRIGDGGGSGGGEGEGGRDEDGEEQEQDEEEDDEEPFCFLCWQSQTAFSRTQIPALHIQQVLVHKHFPMQPPHVFTHIVREHYERKIMPLIDESERREWREDVIWEHFIEHTKDPIIQRYKTMNLLSAACDLMAYHKIFKRNPATGEEDLDIDVLGEYIKTDKNRWACWLEIQRHMQAGNSSGGGATKGKRKIVF